jgi:ABC-type phosphate transport system substrate-binding protein
VTTVAAAMAAGFLGILTQASRAEAADCSTLPSPVYVAGSTAVKPFLAKVAAELAGLTTPITVVYQGQGSCTGINYLVATPTGTISGTGVIWDATGTEVAGGCSLSLAGDAVDIGVSDVYATSCPSVTGLPAGIADFPGPIQAMTFAVPLASAKQSISAEAAYLLFGFGADGAVGTWTDMTQVMVRSATSGTQQMLSAAINVPATKWFGKSNSGSGDVVNGLVAAATPDAAIGILATDVVDKNRSKVRALAYQHYGQTCGYTPDSDATTSFDKRNVRDGHYAVWGALHMLAKVNATGVVTNASAKKVIDYLSLAEAPTGFDLIQLEAKSGVVPDCAMRVTRTSEVGPLASYMPKKSCECKYVYEATGAAPTGCTACTAATAASVCPASKPACNYGFCEVQ